MTDQVRMRSTSTFQNDRITSFADPKAPDGEKGRPVVAGDPFTTDIHHGQELIRLGLAAPVGWDPDEVEMPPLEPHHQVSAPDLAADRAKQAKVSAKKAAEKAEAERIDAERRAEAERIEAERIESERIESERVAMEAQAAADKAAADKAAADKAAADKAAAAPPKPPGGAS